MVNHPNRSKQQPKLSDMTGYEPEAVMVVDRKDYEALKTLNAELLAALKACRGFIAFTQAYERAHLTAGEVNALDETVRLTNAAIAKAEGR